MILWRHRRDARAVHEDDLPGAGLFFQEGRFQPFLVQGAGGIGDAAFIDVSYPRGVAADMNVRFEAAARALLRSGIRRGGRHRRIY